MIFMISTVILIKMVCILIVLVSDINGISFNFVIVKN